MPFKVLADTVVIVHLAWIAFLLLGAFWGVRNRPVKYAHAGGLAFAVAIQVFGWYCPLTYLEAWLRQMHDPALAYPGSFIAHYAEELVYIEISRKGIFAVTVVLVCLNALLYAWSAIRKTGGRRA